MAGHPTITRALQRGMTGLDVKRWQIYLCTEALSVGRPDGDFGPLTEAATRQFQTSQDLDPDGIVAGITLEQAEINGLDRLSAVVPPGPNDTSFFPAIQRGDRGPAVRWWQVFLCTQGLHPFLIGRGGGGPQFAIDGIFGPDTEQQTEAFQSRHGLIVDGIVGGNTQRKAFELGGEAIEVEDVDFL